MERTSMNKIREILRLSVEHGLKNREIGRVVKISHPVVGDYLRNFRASGRSYTEVSELTDSQLLEIVTRIKKRGNKAREILENLFPKIASELKQKGVTLQLLWQEYSAKNSNHYSYSQFCYHFQSWRESAKIAMHIEHKAGDKMFVDFSGQKWPIFRQDGSLDFEAEIFVAVLGASRYTFVKAARSQKKEDWIRLSTDAVDYFGGVCAAIVPDNLKSAVRKSDRFEPDINQEYADFARHYGTVILPARSYKPKDKALVENAVKLVYRAFFAPMREQKFTSLEELNAAIFQRLANFNDRIMKQYQKSRRQLYEETDLPSLKSLPAQRYEMRQFFSLKVQYNYHIYSSLDGHFYSVPYQYRGKQIRAVFSRLFVEVFYENERIALHQRSSKAGGYTTTESHMPATHQYIAGWSPELFLAKAAKIGSEASLLVAEIFQRANYPQQAFRSCMGILQLGKYYSAERLNNACRYALAANIHTYRQLRNILENNMDRNAREYPIQQGLPLHENIRGSSYYEGNKS